MATHNFASIVEKERKRNNNIIPSEEQFFKMGLDKLPLPNQITRTIKERLTFRELQCYYKYYKRLRILPQFWQERKIKKYNPYIKRLSLSGKLKAEKKIDEQFEVLFNNLSLEEVIGLKLELTSRLFNGKFYNFPIFYSLLEIVRDAIVKYAFSCATNKRQIINFLGIRRKLLPIIIYKYDVVSYFKNTNMREVLGLKPKESDFKETTYV